MTIGSGLGATVGTAIETAGSYGTAGTPNKWHPVDKSEIKFAPVFAEGNGLHGGSLTRMDAEVEITNGDAAGTIASYFYYAGMLRYIASLMGGLGTVTPVQNGATTAYTTTLPLASTWNQSLTIQEAIPDVSGALHYWQSVGAKITQGQFECSVGGGLLATFNVDAQDRFELASGTVATPPSGQPYFSWRDMVVKVGTYGSETKVDGVTKWTGVIKRAQSTKRFNAGNLTTNPNLSYAVKDEPNDNGWTEPTGTLETEYLNDALFENYYTTNTPFSLIVTFTSLTMAGTAFPYSVSFNFPRCRFIQADQPTIAGPDIVKPSMPYKVYNDGTHAPCTITIVSQETAQ